MIERIRSVERREVAGDAGIRLFQALGDLGHIAVAVPVVDRFELRAVQGDGRPSEVPQIPAQHHERPAGRLDRRPVVAPEVGDHLVVGSQATGQPHHLEVALRLTLKPSA